MDFEGIQDDSVGSDLSAIFIPALVAMLSHI